MFRYLISIVLFLFSIEQSTSQSLELSFSDNNSPKPLTLTMGFRSGASLGIDSVYGEKELPPFQPIEIGRAHV